MIPETGEIMLLDKTFYALSQTLRLNSERIWQDFMEMNMPFFFSSREPKISILDQSFNTNDDNHKELVRQKLRDFTNARDSLLGLDSKIAIAFGGDTLLYAIGFLGSMTAAIMLVAIGYVGYAKYNRKELATEFDGKLNDLMDVYHWMLKNKTVELTKVDLFMDVAEAIAPFVSRNELTPWKFTAVALTGFSDRYVKLLAQAPHNIQLVMDKQQGVVSTFVNSFSTAPVANIPNEDESSSLGATIVSKARAAAGMFEQTHAEAKRALYGYQPTNQVPRMSR